MLLFCHINLVKLEKFRLSKIFEMTYNLVRREYDLLSCIAAGKNAWDELRISHFNFPATFHAAKEVWLRCGVHDILFLFVVIARQRINPLRLPSFIKFA